MTTSRRAYTDNQTAWNIVSDFQRDIFVIVDLVTLSSIIGFMGMFANITNAVVFIKQGFSNSVNISLLGLALSDLCCLLTMQWVGVCYNPLVINAGAPWVADEFMYLTGAWPHVVFGRVTSYITVYVTAERCLCTIAPLKIKEIITPTRTATAICIIYLLNILSLSPEYIAAYFEWKFFPDRNRTILSITYTSDREKVAGLACLLSSFAGMMSFVAVIVFTSVLVTKLKKSSKWRMKATSGNDQSGPMSNRDKKTVKMIVLIATVLIICYTPGTVLTMTTVVEPAFLIGRKYASVALSMWSLAFVFQTINSSANILMYYTLSSKYRQTFRGMFFCKRKKKCIYS